MKEKDIYSILVEKRESLLRNGDPFAVPFTLKEINILSDLGQLRYLKMKTAFPADFKPAKDIFDCTEKILEGQELYRTLEYCVWKNRVLIPHVTQVFPKIRRD